MKRLTNYSQFYFSSDEYDSYTVNTYSQISQQIKMARASERKVRYIGSSHSLSKCNIPRKDEILLRSDTCNEFVFVDQSTIRVQASAKLWNIQLSLSKYGYELPVINGGQASPTVGGFISAGGIGKTEPGQEMRYGRSCVHGGFWEQVTRIRYIDGNGMLKVATPSTSDFHLLFGSQGQFGIFIEADLKVIPVNSATDEKLLIEQTLYKNVSTYTPDDQRTLWVTLFSAPKQLKQAWSILENWYLTYERIIKPVDNARWAGPVHKGAPIGFIYDINYKTFNPPLVYSDQESFHALGIAYLIETGDYCLNKQIAEAMKRIYSDALSNNLSIYSSVENIASSYKAIDRYSPKIIAEALNLRKENNCHNFLNVGWLDIYESNSGIVANH